MCLALNETAREGLAQLSFFLFYYDVDTSYKAVQELAGSI